MKNKRIRKILVDEHTDLSELLGADQPNSQTKSNSKFTFVNGPLLDGILNGDWIILKHLNLAP
jgi:midasin (ATPase involved in ribosome maturation)